MSNVKLIIEERAASIGQFLVGRLLPFRQKRAVGPFVFIDHMGPVVLKDRLYLDVLPHPHIGLSTLTFLFEGAILHKDSLGNELEITPGAVNWMTAGSGIVHSEETPARLIGSEKNLHGLQIWVALPKELEEMKPDFTHIGAAEIPEWTEGGLNIKLIAGEVLGRKSPVPVHSPLHLLELKSEAGAKIEWEGKLYGESGLYILEGEVSANGFTYGNKQILIAEDSSLCMFEMAPNTTVYIFGGDAFDEERYLDWNFVSSSKTRLKQAREDWVNQLFPKIEGSTDYVPYPGTAK